MVGQTLISTLKSLAMPRSVNPEDVLLNYDGRSTTLLTELVAAQTRGDGLERFLDELSVLAADPRPMVSDGATWILYQQLKSGRPLTAKQQTNFINSCLKTNSWPAKLHICQSLQYLTIRAKERDRLIRFLEPLLEHDRPFLRAWSLDGLCHLARQHPPLRARAKRALASAHRDGSASVRARARKIHLPDE